MKNFDEILIKHTKPCGINVTYKLKDDREITIEQDGYRIWMRGFDCKNDCPIDFYDKKYKRLLDGFKIAKGDYEHFSAGVVYISLNCEDYNSISNLQYMIEKLEKENFELKLINEELKKELDKYKKEGLEYKIKLNNSESKKRNERNAGRKSKLKDNEIEAIRMYRLQGKTIKEISELFGCSVGLIHKTLNQI